MTTSISDLAEIVADSTGASKAAGHAAVERVLKRICDGLSAGDEVRLHGFGAFTVDQQAARMGRNPRTGEEVHVAAKNKAKFKAAKALRDQLNHF